MIFVDRSRVPEPDVLRRGTNSPADREFAKAKSYYRDFEKNRQRGRFQFRAYRHPSVQTALFELFHGKCAYCETLIYTGAPVGIETFRPGSGVVTASGEHLPLHYWWLVNDWSNLYPVCVDCSRFRIQGSQGVVAGKGGRFPLADEGKRAPPLAGPDLLRREQPMLLDPCEPGVEEHLIFNPDGTVAASGRRGQTTIEVLGLNLRDSLVAARRRKTDATLRIFEQYLASAALGWDEAENDFKEQLARVVDASSEYAAMARQVVAWQRHLFERRGIILPRLEVSSTVISARQRKSAKADMVAFQKAHEDYSLEDRRGLDKYHTREHRIERIAIRNMRAIKSLKFEVAGAGGAGPWLMLLGENATGKSTVLQSLALALIGEKYFARLQKKYQIDLAGLVGPGSGPGEVEVRLTGATEPRVMSIAKSGEVTFSGRGAQLLLLAYGSTRLLPRRPTKARYGAGYARIENLFDPFIPLADAERWLMEASEERFDYAVGALKKLLGLPRTYDFDRKLGYVAMRERGVPVPLKRLCDGYQTVIALFVDILDVVMGIWPTPDLAEGVVLLDEVGNHLHPSWKLRFVGAMREFLPRIQVIATTHEPLCLRGLRDGEINVLRRGPRGGIFKVVDLPSIEGMRVDQLLTSEHFGLESTLDPSLHNLFEEYHRLLRLRSPSPAQVERSEAIRSQINHIQAIGQTERERLLLGAIDRFLAERSRVASLAARARLAEGLDEELRSLWSRAPASEESEAR